MNLSRSFNSQRLDSENSQTSLFISTSYRDPEDDHSSQQIQSPAASLWDWNDDEHEQDEEDEKDEVSLIAYYDYDDLFGYSIIFFCWIISRIRLKGLQTVIQEKRTAGFKK